MNTADIILIILIAAAFLGAVVLCIHRKKHGKGCCGGRTGCAGCSYAENGLCRK
ncbi:MAG: FeoB-associated Cys-rich membrane protein [Ruminococcus sp.]|nr:FeoB-associated Cys-rich membrane protein [Ruminococcus sp.]MBR2284640.1 FeoB-associated Cys-rich membrane protein [Ruminococcus sp.]